MGQGFTLRKGIQKSKYDNIVSIDGDGQNNPFDIIKLLNIYNSSENLKLVGGIRKKRKDSAFISGGRFDKLIGDLGTKYIPAVGAALNSDIL